MYKLNSWTNNDQFNIAYGSEINTACGSKVNL